MSQPDLPEVSAALHGLQTEHVRQVVTQEGRRAARGSGKGPGLEVGHVAVTPEHVGAHRHRRLRQQGGRDLNLLCPHSHSTVFGGDGGVSNAQCHTKQISARMLVNKKSTYFGSTDNSVM